MQDTAPTALPRRPLPGCNEGESGAAPAAGAVAGPGGVAAGPAAAGKRAARMI
jgi:hypothetical protein